MEGSRDSRMLHEETKDVGRVQSFRGGKSTINTSTGSMEALISCSWVGMRTMTMLHSAQLQVSSFSKLGDGVVGVLKAGQAGTTLLSCG